MIVQKLKPVHITTLENPERLQDFFTHTQAKPSLGFITVVFT